MNLDWCARIGDRDRLIVHLILISAALPGTDRTTSLLADPLAGAQRIIRSAFSACRAIARAEGLLTSIPV